MRNILRRSVGIILTICAFAFSFAAFFAYGGRGVAFGTSSEIEGDITQLTGTKPALENRISADDLAVIEAALALGADSAAKKKAAIKLYDIANSSRIGDIPSLMLQESTMGIKNPLSFSKISPNMTLSDAAAKVDMRGFSLRSGGNWYGEFVAQVDKTSGSIAALMTYFSTMLKINFHRESQPDKYYFNIIKDSRIEANCTVNRFPYSSYIITKEGNFYDLDGFKNAMNILDEPNEIYNMDFMEEILANDVTITYEDGVYRAHFTVDPNADGELLEQWFRMPKKDMAEGGQELKAYLRYICDVEVWDNGYARSYYAEYVRDAGMGSGITIDRFSYLWNENEILDIISDDYRLDGAAEDKLAKLQTLDDYIDRYINDIIPVELGLAPLYIALIVIGCAAFVVIVAVIVVEVLVRKGKLPTVAAKREAKKQKRAAKKAAKKDYAKTPFALTNDGQGADAPAESGTDVSPSSDDEQKRRGLT